MGLDIVKHMIKPIYYKDCVKEFSSLSNIIDEFDGFMLHKTMITLRDVLEYAYKINIKFTSIDPNEETQQITLVINIDTPNGIWVRTPGDLASYSKEKVQFTFVIDSGHFEFLVRTTIRTYKFFEKESMIKPHTLAFLIIEYLFQIRSLIEIYSQSPDEFHYNFYTCGTVIVFFNHDGSLKLEE